MIPFALSAQHLRFHTDIPPAFQGFAALSCLLDAPKGTSLHVVLTASTAESLRMQSVLGQLLAQAQHNRTLSAFHCAALPPANDANEGDLPERIREERECDLAQSLELIERSHAPAKATRYLLFASGAALFQPLPSRDATRSANLQLKIGTQCNFEALKHRLINELDYDAESVCERPGQFAVRGGLIDVYPLNADAPVRLDFFGDEIEAIRTFDPTTQRSLLAIDAVTLSARARHDAAAHCATLADWLPAKVQWILLEPDRIAHSHPQAFCCFESGKGPQPAFARLAAQRATCSDAWHGIAESAVEAGAFAMAQPRSLGRFEDLDLYRPRPLETIMGVERLAAESTARSDFFQHLLRWQAEGLQPFAAVADAERLQALRTELADDWPATLNLQLFAVDLPTGFIAHALPKPLAKALNLPAKAVLCSERELLGRHLQRRPQTARRQLPHVSQIDEALDFAELADGDPLVHLGHGICLFRGLNRIDFNGREDDAISLEFADKVTLHIPLHDAFLLTRYVGLTKGQPKLARLGSPIWERTRAAAERATLDFAADLLELNARRAEEPGHAFPPDTEWQRAFEAAFPFTETRDQLSAIAATKGDMQAPTPMDRLLCGDVGFGKTEVAIRAAFKAVIEGFQVALLVPTTILAQQHFNTFRERFAPYPVQVGQLSRFRSAAQNKATLAALANGHIDIVIGTHRLLSADVQFKQLGLLVIDEEHRFGVRHKELLKRFRASVDVLSMSATPIPRTLYLALMGARDLSVIETPPADRLPIETIVRQYDIKLVKDAIQRELDRGGQVFYLHNRVQTIDSVAAKLNDLLPNARIAVGHGQMHESTLERIMTRFVDGQFDVLVCTTIIENGIDIPNCNTIIIEGADRFGLSQLYQLRGRVGRFNRQAYAYLLLHRHAQILDLARQRLSAMRQHNQLGAGFRIAMRDLELRGAGNLLGHQQSGHIASVGFDLYCQLLKHAIERLKGDPAAARIRASVSLDFIVEASQSRGRSPDSAFGDLLDAELDAGRIRPVNAHIPDTYLPETRLRIDFYRQLAAATSLDACAQIAEALTDRFGKPPPPLERLLAVTRIRIRAELAAIASVESLGNQLKCCRATPSRRREFITQAGRFPRLTTSTADLRLREIEQFLARMGHTPPS